MNLKVSFKTEDTKAILIGTSDKPLANRSRIIHNTSMKFFYKNRGQKIAIALVVFVVYYIAVAIYEWHSGCTSDSLDPLTSAERLHCALRVAALLLLIFPVLTLVGFIVLPIIILIPNLSGDRWSMIALSSATFLIGDGLRLFLGLVIILFIAYSLYFLLSLLRQPKK